MKKLLSCLAVCIALITLSSTFPTPASASQNFTTDYRVVYSVEESGKTHAVLTVTLTNTTTQFYASSYKLQLGFENITNINVSDPDGPINPTITKADNGYIMDVQFNKKAIGKAKQTPIIISFDTDTIAQKNGEVLEINIPGIANPHEFESFVVEVKAPPSLGKPTYVKPKQADNSLIFTKSQLGKSGISIAFGAKQRYAFNLTYHVKNPNLYPTKTQIALPPTTNYQSVFITSIVPEPKNVFQDKDGNWLAEYTLLSTQTIEVNVAGKAEVRLTPDTQPISQADLAEYVKEKPYWKSESPEIKKLASELKTPKAIYDYVVGVLKYDFTRVSSDKPRLGAVAALQNQNSAACREFTDLFIALARAAGIPAREVNGFALTENATQRPLSLERDILHAWPEYYDMSKNMWIMVDPTWGSTTGGIDYFTTLDLDHFAFVIKGYDSSYPVAAGGYKLTKEEDTKDVQIGFTDTIPNSDQDVEITTTPQMILAGLPIHGKIKIKNISHAVLPQQAVYISSNELNPRDQVITIAPIPPFGHTEVSFTFNSPSFLTNKEAGYTIRIAGETSKQTIKITPFFLSLIGGGTLIGLFTIIILIITIKSRRVRVSR